MRRLNFHEKECTSLLSLGKKKFMSQFYKKHITVQNIPKYLVARKLTLILRFGFGIVCEIISCKACCDSVCDLSVSIFAFVKAKDFHLNKKYIKCCWVYIVLIDAIVNLKLCSCYNFSNKPSEYSLDSINVRRVVCSPSVLQKCNLKEPLINK